MKILIPSACVLLALGLAAGLGVGTPPAALPPAVGVPVANKQPDKPDTIKELQERRIAVLKEIVEITDKAFGGGQVSFEQAVKARLDLLRAQLDAAQTREARVRLLEDMVKQAEALEEAVKRLAEAKTVGRVDALKARAFVLEVRIMLEQAKAAKS